MENGTFGRKEPLEKIKAIKAKGRDLVQIIKIYRKWYGLPASSNDLDAFIVSYSKRPHLQIAKRLISSAVASVEHMLNLIHVAAAVVCLIWCLFLLNLIIQEVQCRSGNI